MSDCRIEDGLTTDFKRFEVDLSKDLLNKPSHSIHSWWKTKNSFFFTFPAFFPIWLLIALIYYIWETSRNKLKIILLPKIVLTFHCLNKLIKRYQKFWKFLAFSLEFQKEIPWSPEHFLLTVVPNNFGNKIPLPRLGKPMNYLLEKSMYSSCSGCKAILQCK